MLSGIEIFNFFVSDHLNAHSCSQNQEVQKKVCGKFRSMTKRSPEKMEHHKKTVRSLK